ncbi:MAG: hypothetical protein WBR18_16075 [Anaerolineales bacterium]
MSRSLPTRWTAIPRDIDLRLAPHRAIMLASIASFFGGGLVAWLALGLSGGQALLRGIAAGSAVFLTWVIARELDPDQQGSAFVGLPLSAVVVIWTGGPDWLALFWVVTCLRIVNRSTGLEARPLDTILLIGLGLVTGWRLSAFFVVLTALALGLDGFLQPGHRWHRAISVILLLVGIALLALGPISLSSLGPVELGVAALGIGLYLGWTVIQPKVKSVEDHTGETLRMPRLRAAQWLGAAIMVVALAMIGPSAIRSFSGLLAAMLGVALYGWGLRLGNREPEYA